MIPGHPGHLPRDSGTERVDGGPVDLGVGDWTLPPTPARWLTPAPWAWAAAVAATILAFLNAVLAALGRNLDWWPVPIALGFAWMGCVLLARRPGHPIGPLLCLIGFVNAISGFVFGLVVYLCMELILFAGNALVYPPNPNAFFNAVIAHGVFFGLPIAYIVRTLQAQ